MHPLRVPGGELTHNLNNGHTFLPYGKLVGATAQLLGVPGEELEDCLDDLAARGCVERERVAGQDGVYLPSLYEAETLIAWRIREMSENELLPPGDMEGLLRRIQRQPSSLWCGRLPFAESDPCGFHYTAFSNSLSSQSGAPGRFPPEAPYFHSLG